MKAKLIAIVLAVGIVTVVVIALSALREGPGAEIIRNPDLSDHPLYSTYEFGSADNVIAIGTQPGLLPTGLITETMKRDGVMLEALEGLGLEVRFYPFLKGYDVNFYLGDGYLDVGVAGDMPAITAATNLEVIITSLMQLGFISIVADRPMMVTELRGKSIGYAYGSNAHYGLLNALASAGITEEQVTLIPLEVGEMPEALSKGEIDAFSAWEPFPTIAVMMDPGNAVVHRSLSSGYLYFSKAFADSHPQGVRQIVAAQIRAVEWMGSDPHNLLKASDWANSIGRTLFPTSIALSVEQTAGLAMQDFLGLHSNTLIPESFLEDNGPLHREFQFLQEIGGIPSSAKWDRTRSSFDQSITSEVLSNPGVYRLREFNYDTDQDNQP